MTKKENKSTKQKDTTTMSKNESPEVAPVQYEVKSVAEAVKLYIERHNGAKPDEVIAFLTKAGAQVSPATVRSQVAAARKNLGLTQPRIAAPVAEIKAAFEAGSTTLAQVLEVLKANGIDASESTVRSQVTKLRKEAGMGRKTFTVSFE